MTCSVSEKLRSLAHNDESSLPAFDEATLGDLHNKPSSQVLARSAAELSVLPPPPPLSGNLPHRTFFIEDNSLQEALNAEIRDHLGTGFLEK